MRITYPCDCMNSKILAAIAAVAIVAVAVALAFGLHGNTYASPINATRTSPVSASPQPHSQANSSRVLFSGTQYAQYSYLIYPGPPSQQAQAALSGFSLNESASANGIENLTITLIGTGQSRSLLALPGYKLYMIETTFGDDGFHFDSSLGDDGFVMVDGNGYIVQ